LFCPLSHELHLPIDRQNDRTQLIQDLLELCQYLLILAECMVILICLNQLETQ
jgi:hypothetical protein